MVGRSNHQKTKYSALLKRKRGIKFLLNCITLSVFNLDAFIIGHAAVSWTTTARYIKY